MMTIAVAFHLAPGPEGGLVYVMGDDPVVEVRLLGEGEIEGALVEGLDHAGVADVFPWRDRPRRHAERKPPGEQRLALRDRFDGETVADQNRGIERKARVIMRNRQPGFQAARSDGDIIAGLGQMGDLIMDCLFA